MMEEDSIAATEILIMVLDFSACIHQHYKTNTTLPTDTRLGQDKQEICKQQLEP